jgi:DNA-binding NtrC family response regulator
MEILIVDDENIVLNSCKRVLEADGYAVNLATSADKAVAAMKEDRFSLILMDIKMPGRDGLSLMREVKASWPEIPVIVMSGYVTTDTISEVSKTDAAIFLAKPFTPDELLEAVRQVLRKEESHGKKEGSRDR